MKGSWNISRPGQIFCFPQQNRRGVEGFAGNSAADLSCPLVLLSSCRLVLRETAVFYLTIIVIGTQLIRRDEPRISPATGGTSIDRGATYLAVTCKTPKADFNPASEECGVKIPQNAAFHVTPGPENQSNRTE